MESPSIDPFRAAGWDILEVLQLDDVELVNSLVVKEEDLESSGVTVRRISLGRAPPAVLEKGLKHLKQLEHQDEFNLVYNQAGQMIGITPAHPVYSSQHPFRYWDLSEYWFEIPRRGDPDAQEKWAKFAAERDANHKLMTDYVHELLQNAQPHLGSYEGHEGLTLSQEPQSPPSSLTPRKNVYVYAEIKLEPPEIIMMEIDPLDFENYLERFYSANVDNPRIIFPVLPSVFKPVTWGHLQTDIEYFRHLLSFGHHYKSIRGRSWPGGKWLRIIGGGNRDRCMGRLFRLAVGDENGCSFLQK